MYYFAKILDYIALQKSLCIADIRIPIAAKPKGFMRVLYHTKQDLSTKTPKIYMISKQHNFLVLNNKSNIASQWSKKTVLAKTNFISRIF